MSYEFQSYTNKACKRKSTAVHNCCLPLHRITVRSFDYKARMWLPDKLTNATRWQFAVHISHYSGSVNWRINREWQRFSLSNMQRKKGSKRIEVISKMANEFKHTVVLFARPNPMQIFARAWIYHWTKKLWKSELGHRASGPSQAEGRGPLGLRTAGPLGRSVPWVSGRWASGLLLAKPW